MFSDVLICGHCCSPHACLSVTVDTPRARGVTFARLSSSRMCFGSFLPRENKYPQAPWQRESLLDLPILD